jgi:hypothetical protein
MAAFAFGFVFVLLSVIPAGNLLFSSSAAGTI